MKMYPWTSTTQKQKKKNKPHTSKNTALSSEARALISAMGSLGRGLIQWQKAGGGGGGTQKKLPKKKAGI